MKLNNTHTSHLNQKRQVDTNDTSTITSTKKRLKKENASMLNISDSDAYFYYTQLSLERDKEYWFYNVIYLHYALLNKNSDSPSFIPRFWRF